MCTEVCVRLDMSFRMEWKNRYAGMSMSVKKCICKKYDYECTLRKWWAGRQAAGQESGSVQISLTIGWEARSRAEQHRKCGWSSWVDTAADIPHSAQVAPKQTRDPQP
jgi:hypothetical protein